MPDGNDRSKKNIQPQRVALVRSAVCTFYRPHRLGALAEWCGLEYSIGSRDRCWPIDRGLLSRSPIAATSLSRVDVFGHADRLDHFAFTPQRDLLSPLNTDWAYNESGRL